MTRASSTRWIRKATRFAILERDGWRCSYCPSELDVSSATLDHLRPESRNGSHAPGNLVAACAPCNFKRKARALPSSLYKRLKRQAAKPLDRKTGRALVRFYRAVMEL